MSNETKDVKEIDLSRRSILKITVAGILAGVATLLFTSLSTIHAAETSTGGKKILIVYYSRTGNTRELANQIHKIVGGDILELQPVEPYPEDYEAAKERASQELKSDSKPALKTKVKDIWAYDVIFVGTPIWWGTMAAPVKTFLSQFDLSGKTIITFCTHEGSGLGRSVADISKLCPKSILLEGIAIRGSDVKTAQSKVSEWLQKNKITK
jgi:flavodoxin